MRWPPVLILAYLAVGLQAGLSGQFAIHGAEANLGLLAAVFVAIHAPQEPAMLACVIIGGMQDLATQQALGLFALSYGIVGWLITSVQQVVYRNHPLTHGALTFLGGAVTAMVVAIQARVSGNRQGLTPIAFTVIYTTILAPLVLGALQRLGPVFGFETGRRRQGY